MRSRSSRLFVVLLHLVGVSNNLPNNPFRQSGIVGVHPLSILLEPLELQAAGGLGELLALLEGAGYDVDKTVLNEPYWLQDDTDGTCLGPSGFSECGDATLWKIRRRQAIFPRRRKQTGQTGATVEVKGAPNKGFLAFFQWNSISDEQSSQYRKEHEWEYALELADVNTSIVEEQEHSTQILKAECIISMPKSSDDEHGVLQMGPCESNEAWSWSIDEGGVLTWERNLLSIREEKRSEFAAETIMGGALSRFLDITSDCIGSSDTLLGEESQSMCLRKEQGVAAVAASCDPGDQVANGSSLVSFSVIQYQNSAAVSPQLPRFPRHEDLTEKVDNEDEHIRASRAHVRNTETDSATAPAATPHNLPTMKRSSQSNAAIHEAPQGMKHKGLKLNSGRQSSTATSKKSSAPIHAELSEGKILPLGVGGYFERQILENKNHQSLSGGKLLHHPPSPVASLMPDDVLHRPRKIPVHPYIAASKNGYYKDEITGLSYPTDISEYLGHDRKESGRHTLTGVGLYTRTMLKIKIYGIAFYIAKRDVLADPVFSDFADKSVEDLRQSDAFYDHLMGSEPLEGRGLDKTLFIILNMQLATETVIQSLTGDWQLLTEEHKTMLSDSAGMERQADERMLRTIQSEENSSNCSCGQSAPSEYEADPTCCARGTEMVFTWRKNGDFELRIGGRIMDIFPYPEIGKGIFYEYLRGDDPMSVDARDHFSDGFPFLLAPLAQLKGFVSKHESPMATPEPKEKKSARSFDKIIADALDGVTSRSNVVNSWIQNNINGGVSNVNSTIHNVGSAAQNLGTNVQSLGSEFDKKWHLVWDQVVRTQVETVSAILSRLPFVNKNLVPLKSPEVVDIDKDTQILSNQTRRNIFVPQIAKMFVSAKPRPISDEIGVIIEPTMNYTHMMFLYLVHFYLVLLLIVSVPDSSTVRHVVKRSSDSTLDSDTDYEERCKQLDRSMSSFDLACPDGMGPWSEIPGAIPRFVVEKNGIESNVDMLSSESDHEEGVESKPRPMKKALSYFL